MSQIFNIEESEISKIHLPEESLTLKRPGFQQKSSTQPNHCESLKYISPQNSSPTLNKPKSVTIQSSSLKKSKKSAPKLIKRKKIHFKALPSKMKSLISKSNLKPKQWSPYDLLNVMNLVRIFIEIIKLKFARKNHKNLNITQINIIDDWAVNEVMYEKNSKKKFQLSNIKNRFLEYYTLIIKDIEYYFPAISVNNKLISFWDLIILFNSSYFVVLTPVELSFDVDFNEIFFNGWDFMKIIPIILLIIDILIKFNKGYYKNGCEILKRNKILGHYIKKGLIYDILALISLIFNYINDKSRLRLLILCKIFFIKEFFVIIEEKIFLKDVYDNILQIFKLFLNIIYTAHLLACIFHALGYYNISENNWLSSIKIKHLNFLTRYVYSFYWAIETLATVGYGDIVPQNIYETLFTCGVMLIGCGVFAYSINSFGYIFTEMMRKKNEKNLDLKILNGMMKRKNLNSDLQNKVRHFFLSISSEVDKEMLEKENTLFKKLSSDLQKEIILNSNANILKKCKLFCNTFSEEFLQSICFKMKHQSYAPDEYLYEEDQYSDLSIFFITKGKIRSYKKNHKWDKEETFFFDSEEEDTLGEYNLITESKYQMSAKSIGVSTAYSISRKDLLSVLNKFPEDKEKFCYLRDNLLMNNNLQGIENKCKLCKSMFHLTENCDFIRVNNYPHKQIFNYLQDYKTIVNERSIFKRKNEKTKRILLENYEYDFKTNANYETNFMTTLRIPTENFIKKTNNNNELNKNIPSEKIIKNEENNSFHNIKGKTLDDIDLIKKLRSNEQLEGTFEIDQTEENSNLNLPRGLSTNSKTNFLELKEESQINEKIKDKFCLFDFEFDRFKNFIYYFPNNNFNKVIKRINKNLYLKSLTSKSNSQINTIISKSSKNIKKKIFKNSDDTLLVSGFMSPKKTNKSLKI